MFTGCHVCGRSFKTATTAVEKENGGDIPNVGDPEMPPMTPASPGLPPATPAVSLFDPFLGYSGFAVEAPRIYGIELSSSLSFAYLECCLSLSFNIAIVGTRHISQ